MCRAFVDSWKRQEAVELQTAALKEFKGKAEQLSRRIREVAGQ